MTGDDVQAVLAESFLASVPEAIRAAVVATARSVELRAGQLLYDPPPSIVVAGRLCAFVTDESGRRLTVAYLQRPRAFGIGSLAGRRFPVVFQALNTSAILRLPQRLFDELRATRAAVAWGAAEELARYLDDVLAESARVAFRPVQARVAHHLLAMTEGESGIARPLHQAELADAVGSVRHVVGRSLIALRDTGLVAADHAGIIPVDRERLREVAERETEQAATG